MLIDLSAKKLAMICASLRMTGCELAWGKGKSPHEISNGYLKLADELSAKIEKPRVEKAPKMVRV